MRQVPFHRPSIGPEEEREVIDTLRSGWITTGPKAKRLENEFAAYVGARNALAVAHCTGALHLALFALGIGPGDEIITTPFTFTATAEVMGYLGARPVFVDIEPDTFNLDPTRNRESVRERQASQRPRDYAGAFCRPGVRHGSHHGAIARRHQPAGSSRTRRTPLARRG